MKNFYLKCQDSGKTKGLYCQIFIFFVPKISGIGMSMAANRHQKIRAARVHDKESVIMTRKHNDANVLCLGERMINRDDALNLVKLFLSTAFEGERHQKRINKIEID